jgi:hypothetical protein
MVSKIRSEEAPGKGVRGIFVLAADSRNAAFWGPGSRFDAFSRYVDEARGKHIPDVFRLSLQDIVARFEGNLGPYKDYFQVKYDF